MRVEYHPVVPITGGRLDWSSAIGLFLINFGTLDYLVFAFLKDRLPEAEFEELRSWHCKDRVERIVDYLADEKYPAAERAAFAHWVDRFHPIRDLRNHLAHGHMYTRLDPTTCAPTVTVFRAKDVDTGWSPDSRHVEFAE